MICALVAFQMNAYAVTDTSESSIVINADTLEIIYQNNAYAKRSMASTTKIMTALLLAESGRLDEIITCTAEMVSVEGSAMGLKAGDKISARDLMYGILLMSGNDAANVCAFFISGSVEEFAKLMNGKAKELGLSSTNFVTPSGLDADEHYTTAHDLAVLTAYALKNDDFAKACSSYSATVHFGDPMVKYTITNHNRLLKSYEGCIGVKTGFTKKSGRCLVSAAERDGKKVIAVTLNDPNDWRDHASLLDYGFEKLCSSTFTSDGNELSLPVLCGENDVLKLDFDDMVVSALSENLDKLKLSVILPDYIFAPVERGTAIGKAIVTYEGRTVAQTPVYTSEQIAAQDPQVKTVGQRIKEFVLLMFKSF